MLTTAATAHGAASCAFSLLRGRGLGLVWGVRCVPLKWDGRLLGACMVERSGVDGSGLGGDWRRWALSWHCAESCG